jgi:DNA-binding phage protein
VPATRHARELRTPASALIKKLAEIVERDGPTDTAKRLGMDRADVYKLLSGERAPGPTTYARLYRAFPTAFPYLRHLLDADQI